MCVLIMRLELEMLEVSHLYQAFLARSSLNSSVGGLARTFPTPGFNATMPLCHYATRFLCMINTNQFKARMSSLEAPLSMSSSPEKMWKGSTNAESTHSTECQSLHRLKQLWHMRAIHGLTIYILYNALTICCNDMLWRYVVTICCNDML